MKRTRYTVYDNGTDFPVIVCGTPAECARAMGVTTSCFYVLLHRFKSGEAGRWHFVQEVCEW